MRWPIRLVDNNHLVLLGQKLGRCQDAGWDFGVVRAYDAWKVHLGVHFVARNAWVCAIEAPDIVAQNAWDCVIEAPDIVAQNAWVCAIEAPDMHLD